MKLKNTLKNNVSVIKNILQSDDIVFFEFETVDKVSAVAVFSESLCDKELLGKQVVEPLINLKGNFTITDAYKKITLPKVEKIDEIEKCVKKITEGEGVILFDGITTALSTACKKILARSIAEPPTSTVLKGPREGFVENLNSNVSLMRQRLKSKDFTFEKITIGKYSETSVGIMYIKGVVDNDLLKNIREKLSKIKVDGIIDSSYIINAISTRKTSLFKEVGTTEKPDVLTAKILEGRIGILIDGSPIAITLPFLLIEDFQSSEDYFVNTYRATISRFLRLSAVLIAIYLPAFFVAAQLFHLQIIPLAFIMTLVGSIKGIPLSPSVEMFVTLFIFEVLNEASVRMPRYVGIAMSVVGALVLGETAVNAGIVSTPTIMIVAISGICLYTVPDMSETLSVLRLLFLIVAGSFGGYGVILLTAVVIAYLSNFKSFGVPYLAPYSPLNFNDLQDGFFKTFYAEMEKRPEVLNSKNKTRIKVKK